MFEYSDLFTWGREVEAHGKKWLLLKSLPRAGYHLAVEHPGTLPAIPVVIYVEPIDTSGKSVDKTGNNRHDVDVPAFNQ